MDSNRIRMKSDPNITFYLHFNPNTNANADIIGYEYKTDSSNLDSNPDAFSI